MNRVDLNPLTAVILRQNVINNSVSSIDLTFHRAVVYDTAYGISYPILATEGKPDSKLVHAWTHPNPPFFTVDASEASGDGLRFYVRIKVDPLGSEEEYYTPIQEASIIMSDTEIFEEFEDYDEDEGVCYRYLLIGIARFEGGGNFWFEQYIASDLFVAFPRCGQSSSSSSSIIIIESSSFPSESSSSESSNEPTGLRYSLGERIVDIRELEVVANKKEGGEFKDFYAQPYVEQVSFKLIKKHLYFYDEDPPYLDWDGETEVPMTVPMTTSDQGGNQPN